MGDGWSSHDGKANMLKTTLHMDGLLTEKDIEDRHLIMKPCARCFKYLKQDIREEDKPCPHCGSDKFAVYSGYWASVRTWNSKKVLSAKDKRKIGATA